MKKILVNLNLATIFTIAAYNTVACNTQSTESNVTDKNQQPPNNGNQKPPTAESNTDKRFDISTIPNKNLGNISGHSDAPTLGDILSKVLEVNKKEYFTVDEVKFSSDPTATQAKIEALSTSVKIKGSVEFTYNYTKIQPSFDNGEINVDVKVFEKRTFNIKINNPNTTDALQAVIPNDDRDAKCLKIESVEKIDDKGNYKITIALQKYIANEQNEIERIHFDASILLKYAGLEKIVHVECQRVNLYQDISDTAIVDLGDLNGTEEHENLDIILNAWNTNEKTKKYQLTKNDVTLDYYDPEEYTNPILIATYNYDSPYTNYIQLVFDYTQQGE
ncbi:hypothetical protein SHELI_v1c08770 [Spiroplasma helicoides]|uniref:Lipoprotein n=1 Tax=Spiroplasma helicoides TaxID=216938 RepID=A0A1B3SLK7_9MOLU|nr:hypothetical protein [Spiroplasma helicoides]AOG60826.1 hypothetical protein SHELI_v1c08770 [Spiroplasma helicoides]